MDVIQDSATLRRVVVDTVNETPALDIHTHLYSEQFGNLVLRGLEALLTYHYLRAELNRVVDDISPRELTQMDRAAQARRVWQELFVKRSPVSEASRGVVTSIRRLGVGDVRDYETAQAHFEQMSASEEIDLVFHIANVSAVVMTNDPFDPQEIAVWHSGVKIDSRFRAALRIDDVLVNWATTWPLIKQQGYAVELYLTGETYAEVRRFLLDWAKKMAPVYMAVSLPDSFKMPDSSPMGMILQHCVIPVARELDIPLAMMLGVRRRVFPELQDAGDALKRVDLDSVSYLCRTYPQNKFMLTVLSRENQHEAAAIARKCRNLHVFGNWWFNNNPSIIEELMRERIEMLGTSFTPIHSDARILEQVVYKWAHSRKILAEVLIEKYQYLLEEGWYPSQDEIERDVAMLLGGEFERFRKMRV